MLSGSPSAPRLFSTLVAEGSQSVPSRMARPSPCSTTSRPAPQVSRYPYSGWLDDYANTLCFRSSPEPGGWALRKVGTGRPGAGRRQLSVAAPTPRGPKLSASMIKRASSAIGAIVCALVSSFPPVTSYDCSNLKPSRCSSSPSLDAFDSCIVTHYSVSELIQCADQDSHNPLRIQLVKF